jgi:lipopolysaccharide/colanic/teichoic acid biosynthesis glycosyltransferase
MRMTYERGQYRPRPFRLQAPPLNRFTTSAIYTPLEFHRLISGECARADRYGSRFSLAVFELGTSNEASVLVRRLVRTLHHRFRDTDDLGWYTPRQLGVIMPFTPSEGAWKLAEYVCSLISAVTDPPAFTIYTYPSQNWPRISFWRRIRNQLRLDYLTGAIMGFRAPGSAEFHALIARERGRADRNNNVFSLIVFDPGMQGNATALARRVVYTLTRRLRDTDEVGWFDGRRPAAILPYVDLPTASRLAEGLCRTAGLPEGSKFQVYTYPQSWFPPDSPLGARTALPPRPATGAPQTTDPREADQEGLYPPIPDWKRVLDVLGASAAIALLSPLMLLALLIIKIGSPGPAFFRQERVGYRGRVFTLLKFRTMRVNASARQHTQYLRKLIVEDSEAKPMTKMEDNPDIIRFGRLLRILCIDEIPQLFNVLRGDMSLVGPRPCIPYEAQEYLRWHTRRFDSLPGMTGLWQVSGKNRTTFKEMIRFDIKYEQNRSLWFDLWILLMTPMAILRQFMDKGKPPATGPKDA